MASDAKKSLINYLMNRRDFVSGSELSDALNVSTKTVSRIVKDVNRESLDGSVIDSRRGRGYRLNWQNYFDRKDESSATTNVAVLSSVERRDEVIKRLLITAPQRYRLHEVWGKYFISESAISGDLKALRRMAGNFHLELYRSNDFIWIDGSESNIRKAIADLLVSDDVIVSSQSMQPDLYVQKRDAAFVSHQLELVEELIHSEIPYPYSVNLYTHLYILIERFRNAKVHIDDGEDICDNDMMKRHEDLAEVCGRVIRNLNEYLNTTLPEAEIYYLYQYLTSSRINSTQLDASEIPERVLSVTRFLIDAVAEHPEYQDINKHDLLLTLSKHMKPLLNRLANHIRVINNLLQQIKLEYPQLFQSVRSATQQLVDEYRLNPIGDEEVGFITVYFAQAMENVRTPVNIILVCTTGLGTAQLLQAKITKRFSEFNIVATVAARNLNVEIAKHPEVHLVVSTIRLPHDIKVPTLLVSAMLTVEDRERMELEASRIRHKEVVL